MVFPFRWIVTWLASTWPMALRPSLTADLLYIEEV